MHLNEIVMVTADVKKLRHFYGEVLGMNCAGENKTLQIEAGASRIIFEEQSSFSSVYHTALTIPENLFEDAVHYVESRTPLLWIKQYNSYMADFRNWNAVSFYFNDPAGNVLEFISRFDLKRNGSGPFNGTKIISISEIGIVLGDEHFEEEAQKFKEKFQLKYYEKQPPGPFFQVMGDVDGLFIVVPEGRPWFGDESKKAQNSPLRVKFLNSGKELVYSS